MTADLEGQSSEGAHGGTAAQPSAPAIALALTAASREKADQFLDKQSTLADLQVREMAREEELRHWALRVRHISDVLKLTLQSAIALIIVAIAAFMIVSVWSAARDKGLVVEAFSVPPDLAARGLTGQVVATRLLDKLTAMQAATDSARPANSYKNNWGDDLKVEIPDTGVSFGELQRGLRTWLGHVTHITGELVRGAGGGLSVTARAGDAAAKTFDGTDADLDTLMQNAAEAIYEQTQPYRYAIYLNFGAANLAPDDPRVVKALAILRRLANSSDRLERGWALGGLSLTLMQAGDLEGGLASARAADAVDPTLMGADDVATFEAIFGHDELALRWYDKTLHQTWHADPDDAAVTRVFARGIFNELHGDFLAGAKEFAAAETMKNYSGYALLAPCMRAEALALTHDIAAAQAILTGHRWTSDDLTAPQAIYVTTSCLPNFKIAAGHGDWPSAITNISRIRDVPDVKFPIGHQIWMTRQTPQLAYATAMTGDIAGAEALIGPTPADCYLCVRMRGKIAAVKQDWANAEHWFTEAARQAPSLPFAEAEWGEMLLAKGDADGAIAKLKLANQKGPHYADPLELWGEALMAKGDAQGAITKFEQAAKFAPNWGRLHMKWGEALAKSGRMEDAKKQFALAATLDLSVADKQELALQ